MLIDFLLFFFLAFGANRLALAQCYAGAFTQSPRYCRDASHHTVWTTKSRKDCLIQLSMLDLCLVPHTVSPECNNLHDGAQRAG